MKRFGKRLSCFMTGRLDGKRGSGAAAGASRLPLMAAILPRRAARSGYYRRLTTIRASCQPVRDRSPVRRCGRGRAAPARVAIKESTMDLGIAGKTALVCAASKGLGRGCAEALAAEGVNLVIVARTPDTLEETAEEIRAASNVSVTAVACDITTPDGR